MAQTFEEALSQIKSQMDIVDIVSEEVVLKKKGSNYWGLCPFHGEKTPSFSVNAERGFFKCFGCGVGGDAITFLMKIHNWDYMQTIKYLAERYNVELPEYNGDGGKHKEERTLMTEACKKAVEFYQDILLSSPSDNIAVKYLNKRDITPAIISKFSLGLSLKEPNMLYNKLKRDYDDSILEKAGLILKSNQGRYVDRFRNRIIIPIQNEQGEYIAFGARAIEEGQNPKYLNSSDSPIYNKSRILYGLYTAKEAIKQEDSVVIMEGYFDVISAQAHKDTFDILKEYNKGSDVVLHCFSGSVEFAKECIKQGWYLSLGGVVTFKNAKKMKEVAKEIPLEHLMLETDAPYLAPVPFRGKTNEPKYIPYIAQEIADLKEISLRNVTNVTTINAEKVFRI